jgi:hypothetical protein
MKYLVILWISLFVSVQASIGAVVAYMCMAGKEYFIGIFNLYAF